MSLNSETLLISCTTTTKTFSECKVGRKGGFRNFELKTGMTVSK